jgi:hypothetical protein
MTDLINVQISFAILCVAMLLTIGIARLKHGWSRFALLVLVVWGPSVLLIAAIMANGFPPPPPREMHENLAFAPTWMGLLRSVVLSVLVWFYIVPFIGLISFRSGRSWASRWKLKWPCLCLALTATGVFVSILAADRQVVKSLQGRRQEARAVMAEAERPPLARENNAATLYERALADMRQETDLPEWSEYVGKADFDVQDAAVVEFLHAKQRMLERLQHAAMVSECQFPPSANSPDAFHRSLNADLEWICEWLLLDARARAAQGDWRRCWERFLAVDGVIRHLGQSTKTDWQDTSHHIEYKRYRTLEAVLALKALSRDALGDAFPIQARPRRYRDAFHRALAVEHAGVEDTTAGIVIQDPDAYRAIGRRLPRHRSSAGPFLRVYFWQDDLSFGSRSVRRLCGALGEPFVPDAFAFDVIDDVWPISHIGMRAKTIELLQLDETRTENAFQVDALASLSDLARAAEGFRLLHGSYPTSLNDLVPEFIDQVPLDPYGGAPLRAIVADGGLVLYSVGWDGEDNGGRETLSRDENQKPLLSDWTFCLGGTFQARRIAPRAAEVVGESPYPRIKADGPD